MTALASLEQFLTGRTPRERILLGVLGALVAILVVWGGLGLLRDAEAGAERRLERASAARSEARRLAALLETRPAPAAATGPVRTQVAETAAQFGLTIASLEPGADGAVTVSLTQAPPSALFRWLGALETQNGVAVRRVSAQPGGGETVEAQVTLGPA